MTDSSGTIECMQGHVNPANSLFCIVCGVSMAAVSAAPATAPPAVRGPIDQPGTGGTEGPRSGASPLRGGRRIGFIAIAVVAALGFIALGIGVAAAGGARSLIGIRYTQVELDGATARARDAGEAVGREYGKKEGYSSGYTVGFDAGSESGYDTGYTAGCEAVFTRAEGTNIIAIYYPFNAFNLGDYYVSQDDACS